MTAFHQSSGDDRRAVRAHLNKYGLEHKDLRRLTYALATLVEFGEAIERAAVDSTERPSLTQSPLSMARRGLRHLLNGARP